VVNFNYNKKRYTQTIGSWPDLTPEKAREAAIKFKNNVKDERHVAPKKHIVANILDVYVPTLSGNSRGSNQAQRLNKWVRPEWGSRQMQSIKNNDVENLKAKVIASGKARGYAGTTEANRVLEEVRTFFRWAAGEKKTAKTPSEFICVSHNPVHPMDFEKETERERILNTAEIRAMWLAVDKIGWPVAPIYKLALLTGKRKDEIQGMRWDEFDMERCLWTIPAARTKTSKSDVNPLSDQAAAIIESLPKIAGSPFVFPMNADKNRPRNLFSRVNARVLELSETEGWSMHDLRRTMRSYAGELDIDPETAERILNHTQDKIRRTYDRFDYINFKRDALQRWADKVNQIIAGPFEAGTVVPMHEKVMG